MKLFQEIQERSRLVLEQATSSRKVFLTENDVDILQKFFECEIPYLVLSLLTEVQGLECISPQQRRFSFEIDEPLSFLEKEDLPHLFNLLNQQLWPLGYGERMILFTTEAGQGVQLHDEWLIYNWFPSVADSLDALLFPSFWNINHIWIHNTQKPERFRE